MDGIDNRDGRPPFTHGRFLLPSAMTPQSLWHVVPLMKIPVVSDAKMVNHADIVYFEDMLDTSDGELPEPFMAPRSHGDDLRGSRKYEQLGVDTFTKILDATACSLPAQASPHVDFILLDLHPGPDLLRAFMLKQVSSPQMNIRYIALCTNGDQRNGIEKKMKDDFTNMALAKEITLPGVTVETEMSISDTAGKPTFPKLQILLWDEKESQLKLPLSLKTFMVPPFNDELQTWLDAASLQIGYSIHLVEEKPSETPKKRKPEDNNLATLDPSPEGHRKRAKLDMIPLDQLHAPYDAEILITVEKKTTKIIVKDMCAYHVNGRAEAVTLSPRMLFSFGKNNMEARQRVRAV